MCATSLIPSLIRGLPSAASPRARLLLVLLTLFIATLLASVDFFGIAHRAVVYALHGDELHTLLASGRLGNRIFQNIAVSALARKFNLVAAYSMESECRELGLSFWHGGSRRMLLGAAVPLTDGLLQELLEKPDADALLLPGRLWLTPTASYFQFPWFARYVRDAVLRGEQHAALRSANPWRARFGANNDTFVHVRLGDTLRLLGPHSMRSAVDFVRAIGARGPHGRVFVASDSPAHGTVRELISLIPGAALIDLSVVQTIQFGATCAHFVLSDGTFSWLIGALASPHATVRIVPHKEQWHGDIAFDDWAIF